MHANDQKTKFALAVLHKTLQHFDSGGTVNALAAPPTPAPAHVSGPSASVSGPTTSGANPLIGMTDVVTNPIAAAGLQGGKNSFMSQISPYLNPVGALLGGSQNNFQAAGANLQAGTNAAQLNNSYDTAQGGISKANDLVTALQEQNGIQNQASNYNQLGQIANGQGPNPAAAMLNNATGTNVANQAALMANQRGSGANTGLIARQAAKQGADTEQQAIGQGAALQANQSLNAINAQAGIAQNQVSNLNQGVTGYNTAAQNEQNILQQANTAYNNANVNMTSNMNNVNAGVAAGNAANKSGILGGVMNAVSSIFAEGGEVEPKYDAIPNQTTPNEDDSKSTPADAGGKKDSGGGLGSIIGTVAALLADGGDPAKAPMSSFAKHLKMAEGGNVPAMVSPGEQYLPPEDVKKVKSGANPLAVGEKIPGTPKYPGNDYRNDVVKKELQAGGIVIPNKIMQSKDAANKAANFVKATEAKKGRSMPKKRVK